MVFLLKFGVGGSQELRGGWSQLALLCALTMAGRCLDFRRRGGGTDSCWRHTPAAGQCGGISAVCKGFRGCK